MWSLKYPVFDTLDVLQPLRMMSSEVLCSVLSPIKMSGPVAKGSEGLKYWGLATGLGCVAHQQSLKAGFMS